MTRKVALRCEERERLLQERGGSLDSYDVTADESQVDPALLFDRRWALGILREALVGCGGTLPSMFRVFPPAAALPLLRVSTNTRRRGALLRTQSRGTWTANFRRTPLVRNVELRECGSRSILSSRTGEASWI